MSRSPDTSRSRPWSQDAGSAAGWVLGRIVALLPRRSDFTEMRMSPRRNVVAGITVGIVALPLALAFGITSGLGAAAGLITAIVAGILAAVFGGSNLQVSGPTGAMTVVLVPIVAQYGTNGVLVVGLMAGLLLMAMAFAGLGRYVKYVPLPVIEGFTLGIAVIIALQQVPSALGVPAEGEQVLVGAGRALGEWLADPQWAPPALALAVAALIMAAIRVKPSVPVALIAVVAATVASIAAHLDVATIGQLPSSLPLPSLPTMTWSDLRILAAPAVAVAALAALESLLSATVADAMSIDEHHDSDRELFGQGIANLAVPLFGGIPATAAIARTAVNVRSGASSRLAAITHSLVLLLVVVVLGPVVSMIPLAALAGVLLATAARMVEVSNLRSLLHSTRSDAAVLVVTFVATVVLDLATAVILGIVVAGALALRHAARSATLQPTALTGLEASPPDDHVAQERALLHQHIVAYRFEGPLFFGGAHTALLELTELSDVRVVILRMSHTTSLDVTGAAVLSDTINDLEHRGVTVLLSGLPDRFVPVLESRGRYQELDAQGHLFEHTPDAISAARSIVSSARPGSG